MNGFPSYLGLLGCGDTVYMSVVAPSALCTLPLFDGNHVSAGRGCLRAAMSGEYQAIYCWEAVRRVCAVHVAALNGLVWQAKEGNGTPRRRALSPSGETEKLDFVQRKTCI